MKVELSEVEKDIKDEVELLMAKYDMTENEFVCFLFEKCFNLTLHNDTSLAIADMV